MKDTTTAETTDPTDLGTNRTGIATSPNDSAELLEGARQGAGAVPADSAAYFAEHLAWAQAAGPVGTMPPPLTLRGVAKTAVQMVLGKKTAVFLNKLGERLAYERTGVRLYDALLVKFQVGTPHQGGPSRAELEAIRSDELRHFGMLAEAIERLGADPTAMTPCADVIGVASQGAIQVLGDPRTTLTQCLDVMLMIELMDQASWGLLGQLADELGHDDLAAAFELALRQEEVHVVQVQQWVSTAVRGQAGIEPTPMQAGTEKGKAA